DEQVLVELGDVLVQGSEGTLDGGEEGAQLIARRLLDVARPVDLRQAIEQRDARRGHGHAPAAGSAAALSVRWAPVSCRGSRASQGSVPTRVGGAGGSTSVAGSVTPAANRPSAATLHQTTPATPCSRPSIRLAYSRSPRRRARRPNSPLRSLPASPTRPSA